MDNQQSTTLDKQQDKDMDVIVLNYLKKRGYKLAEASLKQEANIPANTTTTSNAPSNLNLEQLSSNSNLDSDVTVTNYIMFYNSHEMNSPSRSLFNCFILYFYLLIIIFRYYDSYVKLREWIHSSLDLYKVRSQNFL